MFGRILNTLVATVLPFGQQERELQERCGKILGKLSVGSFTVKDDKGVQRRRYQYFGETDRHFIMYVFENMIWFDDGDPFSEPYELEFQSLHGITLDTDIVVYTNDGWSAVLSPRFLDTPDRNASVYGVLAQQAAKYKVPIGRRRPKPQKNPGKLD